MSFDCLVIVKIMWKSFDHIIYRYRYVDHVPQNSILTISVSKAHDAHKWQSWRNETLQNQVKLRQTEAVSKLASGQSAEKSSFTRVEYKPLFFEFDISTGNLNHYLVTLTDYDLDMALDQQSNMELEPQSPPLYLIHRNYSLPLQRAHLNEVENVTDFLENIDNNLTYYEIPTQLACAYLKGHLTGKALDWFDVLGYKVVNENATDFTHLKQALTEQFPVVRNGSKLVTRFYASYQNHNQRPSEFVYELLKIHKQLKLDMAEEKLLDYIISRLKPKLSDYVEVRHPQSTSSLLQIIDKYEKFLNRMTRGSSHDFRNITPSTNNQFTNRNRQENWRDTRVNNRYNETSRSQRESNKFGGHGVGDNRRSHEVRVWAPSRSWCQPGHGALEFWLTHAMWG
ncbi:uncharacterized protein TNCV_3033261 [Trichonephila clavipes]|nr:uncharacterized protein TNCV_3033261 [Trichonephila clavipes]